MNSPGAGTELKSNQLDWFSGNVQEGKPYRDKPLDKDGKNQY